MLQNTLRTFMKTLTTLTVRSQQHKPTVTNTFTVISLWKQLIRIHSNRAVVIPVDFIDNMLVHGTMSTAFVVTDLLLISSAPQQMTICPLETISERGTYKFSVSVAFFTGGPASHCNRQRCPTWFSYDALKDLTG